MVKVARKARKPHRCDMCRGAIEPGDVYLIETIFPGHDSGYAGERGHGGYPVSLKICADDATKYKPCPEISERQNR